MHLSISLLPFALLIFHSTINPTVSQSTCSKQGDNCYPFIVVDNGEVISWPEANLSCASTYGTYLAVITSEEEAEIASSLVSSVSNLNAWIGLRRNLYTREWQWVDGVTPYREKPCQINTEQRKLTEILTAANFVTVLFVTAKQKCNPM